MCKVKSLLSHNSKIGQIKMSQGKLQHYIPIKMSNRNLEGKFVVTLQQPSFQKELLLGHCLTFKQKQKEQTKKIPLISHTGRLEIKRILYL